MRKTRRLLRITMLCLLIGVPFYGKQHKAVPIVQVTYKDMDQEIKDKVGVPLLHVVANSPQIQIADNKTAAQKINAYYEEKWQKFMRTIEEYTQYAKEDYDQRTPDQKSYWHGYELGESYEVARADTQVISLIDNQYAYTGGAHPNAVRSAQNFRTSTGELLGLADVLTDVPAAKTWIDTYILEETRKEQYKNYFFPDYEAAIKDLLTENTWYLSEEGLVVIANEYIISPHAVGILTFTIPYAVFPYINKAYVPVAK